MGAELDRLGDIGFEKVGHWILIEDQIELELTGLARVERVLYAFISQNSVKYIGKTNRTLEKRLYGYKSPGLSQSTNIKNNAKIREILSNGGSVEIWALANHGQLQVGEFRLDLAAGLEDDIIAKIQPPWNGREDDRRKRSTKLSEPIDVSVMAKCLSEMGDAVNQGIDILRSRQQFEFLLRKTYFDQGFFNVGVDFEALFAGDGAQIEIRLGKNQNIVNGYVNRTANLNGTPRIMGRTGLRSWFQRNFEIDGPVQVEVLSKTSIWIHRPE